MAAGAVCGDAAANGGGETEDVGHQSPSTSQVPSRPLSATCVGGTFPVTRWRGTRETLHRHALLDVRRTR